MKRQIVLSILVVAVSAGALGYWFGFNAASTHRFIPYSESPKLAFDSKTGQICHTFLPVPSPVGQPGNAFDGIPQCTELK
jgi:hypothetical protein